MEKSSQFVTFIMNFNPLKLKDILDINNYFYKLS